MARPMIDVISYNPVERALNSYYGNIANQNKARQDNLSTQQMQAQAPYYAQNAQNDAQLKAAQAKYAMEKEAAAVQKALAEGRISDMQANTYMDKLNSDMAYQAALTRTGNAQANVAEQTSPFMIEEARNKALISQMKAQNPLYGTSLGNAILASQMYGQPQQSQQPRTDLFGQPMPQQPSYSNPSMSPMGQNDISSLVNDRVAWELKSPAQRAAEEAYSKKGAELEQISKTKLADEAYQGALDAQSSIENLDRAKSAFDSMISQDSWLGLQSGPIGGRLPAMSSAAQDFDQAVESLTASLLPQLKGAISDKDIEFLRRQTLSRTLNPESMDKIYSYLRSAYNRKQEYSDFVLNNPGKTKQEIQREWSKIIKDKPLFEKPMQFKESYSDEELSNMSAQELSSYTRWLENQ